MSIDALRARPPLHHLAAFCFRLYQYMSVSVRQDEITWTLTIIFCYSALGPLRALPMTSEKKCQKKHSQRIMVPPPKARNRLLPARCFCQAIPSESEA